TGVFSGTLVLDGGTNSFSSRFDTAGASSFVIARSGKSSLQVNMQLDFAGQITGVVGNGTWTANLIADRRGYMPTNPPPFAGLYTVVFPGVSDFTVSPGGYGFGTVTVDTAGRASIDGRMGDN